MSPEERAELQDVHRFLLRIARRRTTGAYLRAAAEGHAARVRAQIVGGCEEDPPGILRAGRGTTDFSDDSLGGEFAW